MLPLQKKVNSSFDDFEKPILKNLLTFFGEEATLPPFPCSRRWFLKGGDIYGRL